MLSKELEATLHRTLAYAGDLHHQYATLEHLLLALTEDRDVIPVLLACGADVNRLQREVRNYVDNELANLVDVNDVDAKPTSSFQRVLQRAAIHVASSGREDVTGANVLVAMFAERESHAAYFLTQHNITRYDAISYIDNETSRVSGRSLGKTDDSRDQKLLNFLGKYDDLTAKPSYTAKTIIYKLLPQGFTVGVQTRSSFATNC
jgi:ATP-dependent Clp protease ATP-binding subunit ClpA